MRSENERSQNTLPEILRGCSGLQKTAVISGDRSVTYAELIRDAVRIAAAIAGEGIGRGERVMVILRPGIEYMTAVLGIMFAGAVYVSVDPEWPEERLQFIFGDCDAAMAVTELRYSELMEKACSDYYRSDEELWSGLPQPRPDDRCCIYYTSGSTGNPKGAYASHRMLLNSVSTYRENTMINYTASECSTIMSMVNCGYAFSRVDYFMALVNAMTLVIATDEERLSPAKLGRLIERTGADAMGTTPSVLVRMLEYEDFRIAFGQMKRVLITGEPLSMETAETIASHAGAGSKIYNGYGSTEMSHCAYCEFDHEPMHIGTISHGVEMHVLREDLSDADDGEAGCLYIGGSQAEGGGYVNRPDLDAEKYLQHHSYGRLFRTGDSAMRGPDGRIWLQGRSDGVIKLRGQRIDPRDIEGLMEGFEGIRLAAVKLQGEGASASLAAYYTADIKDADIRTVYEGRLRRHLADRLPYYMVPSHIIRLDDMPLNASGKIDRDALPGIEAAYHQGVYAEPRTENERLLCRVLEDVLHPGRPVGINDSFFELGGDSVTAMAAISEIRGSGRQIRMQWIFAVPVIRELAAMMEPAESKEAGSPEHWEYPLSDEDRRMIYANIPPEDICEIYPMMPENEYGYRYRNNRDTFHLPVAVLMKSSLSPDQMRARYDEMTQKRQYLRSTIITASGGKPFVVVLKEAKERMFYADIRSVGVSKGSSARHRITQEQIDHIKKINGMFFERGFAEGEPMIHAGLLRTSDEYYVFYLICSHYILDWVAVKRVISEFVDQYMTICADDELIRDYHRRICEADLQESVEYWQELLHGCGGLTRLPDTDGRQISGDLEVLEFILDNSERSAIDEYCLSKNVTLAAMMQYAFGRTITEELKTDAAVYYNIGDGRSESITDDCLITGMFSVHAPFIYRRGDTVNDCQQQILQSKRHEWVDLGLIGPEYDNTHTDDNVIVMDIINSEKVSEKDAYDITAFIADRGGLTMRSRRLIVASQNRYRLSVSFCFDTAVHDIDLVQRIADRFKKELLDAAGLEVNGNGGVQYDL